MRAPEDGQVGHPGEDDVRRPLAVEAQTFCRACLASCGLLVTIDAGRITKVRGDPDHPWSRGYTCPKGRATGELHHRADRLDRARMRSGVDVVEVDAATCLDDLCERLNAILAAGGPSAVGFYFGNGAGVDTAGGIVADRLVRALGTPSRYTALTVDCPCKPLVAELMAGSSSLSPVVDEEQASLVLFLGSNPVVSHGHTWLVADPVARIRRISQRGAVWVVDPRRSETTRLADRHLAARAGSDYAILAFLARELLLDGADREYAREHTVGVHDLARAVAPFTLDRAAAITGLASGDLSDLLEAIRSNGQVAIQTGTGCTMSATANVTEWLAWAVQIITGSFDRRGGSLFNPGFFHRLDAKPHLRATGEAQPGPPSRPELPSRLGLYPSVAIADEIEGGHLRALVVLGGNPVSALPDTDRVTRALSALEVLVVADIAEGDMTSLATHVLPCPSQFERADITLVPDLWLSTVGGQYTPAIVALGAERRPTWWWFAEIGRRLGCDLLRGLPLDECTDNAILAPVINRSASSFETLAIDRVGEAPPPPAGWVEAHILPDGRWQLAPAALVEQLSALDEPAPLVLIPRRQVRHLNSAYRHLGDRPDVLLNPTDAASSGIAEADIVLVRSLAGEIYGVARLTDAVSRGVISVPHGFDLPNVNRLTSGERNIDPLTGMALYSGLPVTIARV